MKSFRYLLATVLLLGLSGACAEGSPADEEFPGVAGNGGAAGAAGMAGQAGKDAGLGGATGQGGADAAAGGATSGGAAGAGGSAGGDGGAGQAGGAGGASAGGSAGSGGLIIINSGGSSGTGGSAGSAGAGTGGVAGAAGASTGGSAGAAGASTGGSAGAAGASAGGSAGSAGAAGGSAGTGGAAGAGGTGGAAGATGTGGSPCVPPVSGACDTVPQCGCLPTDNCDVTTVAGETACVAAGTVAPYNNCTNFGECQVGHTCVGGVCKPFCDTTAECPGSAYRACDQVYADQTPIPSFRVCTQQCNPRAPLQNTGGFSACGNGTLCIATPSGSSDCIGPAGPGVQNSSCASETDCSAGFTCVQVDIGDLRCLKWCTTDYDCPGLYESCYTFTTPLFAGTVEYGVCFDPYY